MNNQDFKKLLRENIEARKEKELEEGKIGDFFNKIMSGVKGSEKSSPLNVTANYIKNRLIDGYKKTGQNDKAEDSNLIDQLTKRLLASAKTTIEDDPNVNSENLIKTLKDMVDAITRIKDEESSEDSDSEDQATDDGTLSSEDEPTEEVPFPNLDIGDDDSGDETPNKEKITKQGEFIPWEKLKKATKSQNNQTTWNQRLHESLRRERDEEIYNKLMKRLNN